MQLKKILVADDSEFVLTVLVNTLETENYLTIVARDGLSALKIAVQEKPDLIITDVVMPKLDGMSLVKKLKSELSTRLIPIIILTTADEIESEVVGFDAGADDYLTKPFDSKRLLARVNRLLK